MLSWSFSATDGRDFDTIILSHFSCFSFLLFILSPLFILLRDFCVFSSILFIVKFICQNFIFINYTSTFFFLKIFVVWFFLFSILINIIIFSVLFHLIPIFFFVEVSIIIFFSNSFKTLSFCYNKILVMSYDLFKKKNKSHE